MKPDQEGTTRMSLIKRKRPSPAMVIAALAVAFAMVGTAVAGTDVAGKLTKPKVKKIARKQADKELRANISGSHVNEADHAKNADNATNATNATNANHADNADNATNATNATNASHATSADSVGGVTFGQVNFRRNAVTAQTTFFDQGGLQLKGTCAAGGDIDIVATSTTTGNTSTIRSTSENLAGASVNNVNAFISAVTNIDLMPTDDDDVVGQTVYQTLNGPIVTLNWAADNDSSTAEPDCSFFGTASVVAAPTGKSAAGADSAPSTP